MSAALVTCSGPQGLTRICKWERAVSCFISVLFIPGWIDSHPHPSEPVLVQFYFAGSLYEDRKMNSSSPESAEIHPGICLLTHVDDKRCESWLNNLCYTTHFQFILSWNFADKEYLSKSAFWAVINFLASSHASFKNTSYKSYVSIFNISLVWFLGGKK